MAPPFGYGSREELEAAEAANRAELEAERNASNYENAFIRRRWKDRSRGLEAALEERALEAALAGRDRTLRRPPPPPPSLGGPPDARRRPDTSMYMKQSHDPYADRGRGWSSSGDPRLTAGGPETREEWMERRLFEIERMKADEDFQRALDLVRQMRGTPPGSEVYETGPRFGAMREDRPGIPFFRRLSPDYSPDWRQEQDEFMRWREAGSPPIR